MRPGAQKMHQGTGCSGTRIQGRDVQQAAAPPTTQRRERRKSRERRSARKATGSGEKGAYSAVLRNDGCLLGRNLLAAGLLLTIQRAQSEQATTRQNAATSRQPYTTEQSIPTTAGSTRNRSRHELDKHRLEGAADAAKSKRRPTTTLSTISRAASVATMGSLMTR